jgi:hypothetical protein
MFGIPKEGYGSSGKGHNECPSFSDAVFSYDGDICKCLYLFTIKFNTQLFFPNKVLLTMLICFDVVLKNVASP